MNPLKLCEVIWEINARCNRNCTYCGSKGIIKPGNELPANDLVRIAQQIQAYGVNNVTLSGGEPGLLSPETLKDIWRALRPSGKKHVVTMKAVTNGTLFINHPNEYGKYFDRIGLSVNSVEDINRHDGVRNILRDFKPMNVTLISNFGRHNWFEFDEIHSFYSEYREKLGLMWQVQLTTGNEFVLPPNGITELREKLVMVEGVALADCLQEQHECTAGLRSCGILWDGGVVGCLAERTYIPTEKMTVYGGLVGNSPRSLKEIWESEFRDIRFGGTRKSCRDCIKYPKCKPAKSTELPNPFQPGKPVFPVDDGGLDRSIVVMYGVVDKATHPWNPLNEGTYIYGVSGTSGIIMYGVFGK